MAINWDVKIQVVDLARKEVSVTAVRTDDSVTPPDVRSYRITSLLVDTAARSLAEIRQNVVNMIWDKHQAALATEQKAATLLSGWEKALVTDLNAKEGI